MRRWMVLSPGLFAILAAVALSPQSPRALAQDPVPPVEETFMTADGVQLHGLFHKSLVNPGNDPVVIMLYPPGKDNNMTKGDWKGLADRLTKQGYNVFRFDWRGHGKSTDIKDTNRFWNIATPNQPNPNSFTGPWNLKYINGAPINAAAKKRIKNDIEFKDIRDPVRYAPTFLQDLAAVRYHLDTKNDAGDVNTSSIYLIGSDVAATIGFVWMTAEWNRPEVSPGPNALGQFPRYEFVPQPLVGGITAEAGEDISGAIWLSAKRADAVTPRTIQDWIAKGAPKLRDNNHMLFLFGGNDRRARSDADFFFDQVLVASPPPASRLQPLTLTKKREIKDKEGKPVALSGAALLGNDGLLKTESTIEEFLGFIQKERAKLVRKQRGFTNPYFVDLSAFGLRP
jgi:pimeloyl-ACP methyl ester carboxylesterase